MVENVQKKRKSHTKIYVSPLDCFYINILIEKCQTNIKIYCIFHKINIDVNFRIETNNRNVNLKRKEMQKGVSAGMNPVIPSREKASLALGERGHGVAREAPPPLMRTYGM